MGAGSTSVLCRDNGTAWVAVGSAGGSGTVTSVAFTAPTGFTISGSPITTAGTFALGLSPQPAGRVWAGPANGADAAPAFRDLVATDIPDLSATYLPVAGNAATATALAANGTNCGAGQAAAGVDASGNAEGCAAYLTSVTAHAASHAENASDELLVEALGTACPVGETAVSDGAGGLDCAAAGGSSAGASGAVQVGDGAGGFSDSGVTAGSGTVSVPHTTQGYKFSTGAYMRVTEATNDVWRFVTSRGNGQFQFFPGDQDGTEGSYRLLVSTGGITVNGSATVATYVDVGTCRIYGSLASPPAAPVDCWQYYDTSGAQCLRTGGAWVVLAGAGSCD